MEVGQNIVSNDKQTVVISVVFYFKEEEEREKKPWFEIKILDYLFSHLNPLQTYFCGELLSWINVIFSEVKSFSCFTIRLFFSVSEYLGQASNTRVKINLTDNSESRFLLGKYQ